MAGTPKTLSPLNHCWCEKAIAGGNRVEYSVLLPIDVLLEYLQRTRCPLTPRLISMLCMQQVQSAQGRQRLQVQVQVQANCPGGGMHMQTCKHEDMKKTKKKSEGRKITGNWV